MNAFECMLKRRSIRAYDESYVVSDEEIKKLLEAAMAAPSAKNQCPYEFYVIKDKKVQVELRSKFPQWDKNSSLLIVPCIVVSKTLSNSLDDYAIEDVSSCITNMLNEACELNLSSLWCGAYPKKDRYKVIQDILKLNDDIVPVALLHFGKGVEDKEARTQYDEAKIHIV